MTILSSFLLLEKESENLEILINSKKRDLESLKKKRLVNQIEEELLKKSEIFSLKEVIVQLLRPTLIDLVQEELTLVQKLELLYPLQHLMMSLLLWQQVRKR